MENLYNGLEGRKSGPQPPYPGWNFSGSVANDRVVRGERLLPLILFPLPRAQQKQKKDSDKIHPGLCG